MAEDRGARGCCIYVHTCTSCAVDSYSTYIQYANMFFQFACLSTTKHLYVCSCKITALVIV